MTSSSIIKHASNGLKHRSVRDYLKMRFAKAVPAAGRVASNVGGAAKGLASNMHVQGIAGGMAAHRSTKRKSDTEVEAQKRSGAASGGAYLATVGAHMGVNALKLRSRANNIAHTATANRVRSIGNTMGGLAVGAGVVGAARLHQSSRKNAAQRKEVKASFDVAMVLSHDAESRELQLSRAFADRTQTIGSRVDATHTTVSQRGGQVANAIGGAAALGAGSKLMHKAPITAAVKATLKTGGIRSSAMKLAMRSRGIAGVAAIGAGAHLLNKARKPIAASHEGLELGLFGGGNGFGAQVRRDLKPHLNTLDKHAGQAYSKLKSGAKGAANFYKQNSGAVNSVAKTVGKSALMGAGAAGLAVGGAVAIKHGIKAVMKRRRTVA